MKLVGSVLMGVSVLGGCVALSGCAPSFSAAMDQAAASSMGKLQGSVHGGQNPVANAAVYVYEANQTAYAGPGILASSNNASRSLLSVTGANTVEDGDGLYYVPSDSGGNFTITGDYTCDSNQVVYLYAVGGNAGSGTNSAIGFMAILGQCPNGGGNLASLTPFVFVDELTTVAAAYALSGFATDALHVGYSGTVLGLQGIQNAAANANNLVNVATGSAYATTPGSVLGNVGTVPYQTIDTLGNILAACINSSGSGSAACTTLLGTALSGGTSGAEPTDTATAAINIAHNPGANVSTLYGLQQGIGAPFASDLGSVPNDFGLAVLYTGGGLNQPFMVAVDASGNVWASNFQGNSLSEFSPLGVAQSSSAGFTGGGLSSPGGLAIDTSGNVWVKNLSGTVISEFTSGGVPVSSPGYTPTGFATDTIGAGIAFDAAGNLWVSTVPSGTPSIMEVYATGGSIGTLEAGPFAGGGQLNGTWLAVDPSQNIWTTNGEGTVSKFNAAGVSQLGPSGASISNVSSSNWISFDASGDPWVVDGNSAEIAELNPSTGATLTSSGSSPGGVSDAYTVQVDPAGSIWTSNDGGDSISQLSISGTTISGDSPSAGYLDPNPDGTAAVVAMQLDGSGDVWAVDSDSFLIQWVGIAAPQFTPVASTKYATLP